MKQYSIPIMAALCMVLSMWLLPLSPPTTGSLLAADLDPETAIESAAVGEAIIADPLWTRWNSEQHALADDGDAIWIGGAGSIVRWDKESQTHRRYSAVDGLPHTSVLAVAVDAFGNRWFGGDGGLSRLDSADQWRHFTTANSGIDSDFVDGIAIAADGTLWVSHGLPDGSVSRRSPDGAWRSYPNRAVAVVTDYAQLVATINTNPLWTVNGDEVWVGYSAYNGEVWIHRVPPQLATVQTPGPLVVAADSTGTVWVLDKAYDYIVHAWDGATWTEFPSGSFSGSLAGFTTLAVAADDTVWVGGLDFIVPWEASQAIIGQLLDLDSFRFLDSTLPPTALLPKADGLWAIGAGWLLLADNTIVNFPDMPTGSKVTTVLRTSNGSIWMHSQEPWDDCASAKLQSVDDRGDAVLNNDDWSVLRDTYKANVIEQTPGGDIWLAWDEICHNPYQVLEQYHGGAWRTYEYYFGQYTRIVDIFAQDERHIWFAYGGGVLAFDEGADRPFREYPIDPPTSDGAVAVDVAGQVWLGNSNGLFRLVDDQWQLTYANTVTGKIYELTPLTNGDLLVQTDVCPATCDSPDDTIVSIHPNGETSSATLRDLVAANFTLLSTSSWRNRMWTVAPDGAIWYASYDGAHELHRRSATELEIFRLPFTEDAVRSLVIDQSNHAWLVANKSLWRLSSRPDFNLTMQSQLWLLQAGASQQRTVQVGSLEGYTEPVTLAIDGLPTGMTGVLSADTVSAGNSVTLTLTAESNTPLGSHPVTLRGSNDSVTHTLSINVVVADQLFDLHLPAVRDEE